MAVGDLITRDYQYEFNGLLMGAGTPYRITNITGLLGMPDVKSSDLDRQDAWGDFPGRDLYAPRTIAYDVFLKANAGLGIEQAMDALCEAHTIQDIPTQWCMQRPDGRGKRFLWARPRKADFNASYDTSNGLCLGSAMVKAHDPRIYSLVLRDDAIAIANAALNGAAVINNAGKIDIAPIIVLNGPMTNPRIANAADNGKAIKLDYVLAAGHSITIDVRSRTVVLDAVADIYRASVREDNQWWKLKPGGNAVTVNRDDNGAATSAHIQHRDGWIS